MKKIGGILTALVLMFIIACDKESYLQESSNLGSSQLTARNGSMTMDVYYDDEIFAVNMFELSDDAAEKALEHNKNIGEIYTYCDLDEECDWLPIIDSVPGDGYNPLWQEVEIEFADGVDPYQFTSDTEIEEAAENGEITLTDSGEVYRCAVVGHSH
jgi:hypothetical protein